MANITIQALVELLAIVKLEAETSQSSSQIVGVFSWDAQRLGRLLDQGRTILSVEVCDTPETHPAIAS